MVIHQGRPSEQTEASRTAQHRTKHMLCRLLEPVTYCILKFLVPHHGTWDGREADERRDEAKEVEE